MVVMSPTEHDGHDPDAAPTTGATAVEGTGAHRHGRRYWVPAAAVAAAVVVIGGSVLVLGTRAAPTSVTAAAANTAPTSSQANPVTAAPGTVAGALSGKVMLQRFVDLVPRPGTLTHFVDLTHGGAPGPAQVVFNDGHGAAEIIVGMQTATTGRPALCPSGDVAGTTDHPAPASNAPALPPRGLPCTTLPGGTQLRVIQGPEYPNGHTPNATRWSVDVLRPDTIEVSIHEWNAPTEKGSAPSRAVPPLTIAELTTIATDPGWTSTVSPDVAARAAALHVPNN